MRILGLVFEFFVFSFVHFLSDQTESLVPVWNQIFEKKDWLNDYEDKERNFHRKKLEHERMFYWTLLALTIEKLSAKINLQIPPSLGGI